CGGRCGCSGHWPPSSHSVRCAGSGSGRACAWSRALDDAVLGPAAPAGPGLRAQAAVELDALRGGVAALVVQVHDDGAIADALAAYAGILQPLAELPVLATVAHALVEAVDRQHVGLPAGGVVPVPAGPGRAERIKHLAQAGTGGELDVAVGSGHPALGEPRRIKAALAADVVVADRQARLHRQLVVAAGQEPARLAQAQVGGYEIGPRYAVTVGEDQVVRGRGADRHVHRLALAEAIVRLPQVPDVDRQRRGHRLDPLAGFVPAAVIGHQYLEVGAVLGTESHQYLFQPVGLVVGGEHDAGNGGLGHGLGVRGGGGKGTLSHLPTACTPMEHVQRPKISATVITYNEADRIGECLASLAFCDEILVVDSGSTDATRELAEAAGARVLVRAFDGFRSQKQYAVDQARHDWILSLDADESLGPELATAIAAEQARGFAGAAGYRFSRSSEYFGRYLRHGNAYPDRKLRLFDRRRGGWRGEREIHETASVDGEVVTLSGDLLHRP